MGDGDNCNQLESDDEDEMYTGARDKYQQEAEIIYQPNLRISTGE